MTPLARAEDFKEKVPQTFKIGETEIIVYKIGDQFFAYENACLHRGAPLTHSTVDEKCMITCPWHGWRFDVKTGSLQGDQNLKLTQHKVKVQGEMLMLLGKP